MITDGYVNFLKLYILIFSNFVKRRLSIKFYVDRIGDSIGARKQEVEVKKRKTKSYSMDLRQKTQEHA